MGNKIIKFFVFLKGTLVSLRQNIDDLKIESEYGSRDLEEILRNPEDRNKFEETVEKLKNSPVKSQKVNFSDRELEISIE